jgi:alpha-D-xyloside xylohydrolase
MIHPDLSDSVRTALAQRSGMATMDCMTDDEASHPNRRILVSYLRPRTVRITQLPPPGQGEVGDRPWLPDVLLPGPALDPAQAEVRAEATPRGMRVKNRAGELVVAEARPARLNVPWRSPSVVVDIPAVQVRAHLDRSDAGIALAFGIQPGELFYGWGEWFDQFSRRSGRLRLNIRDSIALIQQRNTYSAIPMYFSSLGYAVWLLNSHETSWNIDPDKGVLEVAAAGPGADYIVFYGPSFRDILADYTALTGRPPLLPRWALGVMATGYPQEAQDVMAARVQEHRQRRIPLDALILDYHWEERFHNFRWRRRLFPDPDGLIATLRDDGVRLGLIFTPFVNSRRRPRQKWLLHRLASNVPAGCEADDECATPEYEYARAQGYLAHDDAPWWFGAGGMIDFSNERAAGWWNERLRPLYDQGIAFFKNDDGEYLPRDGRSSLGLDGREYHNLYGFYYGRAIYQGMEELDDRRGFIFARSVWAGSQRYPALFLGDQKPTFAHLASTLRAGLNLGLLGFAHWTADVFGLDGKTTPETHQRYAQWALLVPVARYFWRPPDIDDTRFPWSHGPECEANFRKYAELRYRLLPYYHSMGWQSYLSGMPVLRPMVLSFQEDERMAGVDDQAMLGDCLLIAPVLVPSDPKTGVARRMIVLPRAATWHDFWTAHSFGPGAVVEYEAPLDRLPLLVRGGSILPMGPALMNIADDHVFDRLEFHCWPPYPAEMIFYDDDGRTRAYQAGAYSSTRIAVEGSEALGAIQVRFEAAHGGFPGQVAERAVTVVLQRCGTPTGVRINGKPAADAAWRYASEARTLEVRFNCRVDRATLVEVPFRPESAGGSSASLAS